MKMEKKCVGNIFQPFFYPLVLFTFQEFFFSLFMWNVQYWLLTLIPGWEKNNPLWISIVPLYSVSNSFQKNIYIVMKGYYFDVQLQMPFWKNAFKPSIISCYLERFNYLLYLPCDISAPFCWFVKPSTFSYLKGVLSFFFLYWENKQSTYELLITIEAINLVTLIV